MEFRSKSSQHLIVNLFVFFTVFRGKEMLQFDDEDLSDIGGYDLVHHDDLAYVASAHQECKPNLKIVNIIVMTSIFQVKRRKFWASFVENKKEWKADENRTKTVLSNDWDNDKTTITNKRLNK